MRIQFSAVVAIFAFGMLGGCASVPMGDAKQDAALKQFQAKPNVAGIYVYRNENLGAAIKMDVEVDGKNVGQTAAKTYLYKEVAPGKHIVTGRSENTDNVEINAVAGKLYYVWQEVKMGLMYAGNKLHLVDEVQGQKGVSESSLAETK